MKYKILKAGILVWREVVFRLKMNRTKELMAAKIGGSNRREGSAKATVSDHLSQTITSTSNLLQHMLQSSPSQAQLRKIPKNLLEKTSTIKNTEKILNQLPPVVSSLDAYTEIGLKSGLHLNTILQLNETIKMCQLKCLTSMQVSPEEPTEAQSSEEGE